MLPFQSLDLVAFDKFLYGWFEDQLFVYPFIVLFSLLSYDECQIMCVIPDLLIGFHEFWATESS